MEMCKKAEYIIQCARRGIPVTAVSPLSNMRQSKNTVLKDQPRNHRAKILLTRIIFNSELRLNKKKTSKFCAKIISDLEMSMKSR